MSGQLLSGAKRCWPAARAAAAVADAVGAGAVPRHANEERAVVAEVGRPPLLRVGHQAHAGPLTRRQVEALELRGVVEVLAHRVGQRGMLVEDVKLQLVRPPVTIRASGGRVGKRAFAFYILLGCLGMRVNSSWSFVFHICIFLRN